MKRLKKFLAVGTILVAAPLFAQPPGTPSRAKNPNQKSDRSYRSQLDGQRVFMQNCSRCHRAPEGFSPQISGTIVRHMRVRASLSKKDAQALLRFLNP